MRAYQIQDNHEFMKQLLLQDTFDTFLVRDASITTFASFRVDGRFQDSYFGADAAQQYPVESSGLVLWKRVRPFFWELTKGKLTPLSFAIVFRLSPHNTARLLTMSGVPFREDQVEGLYLNVRYENRQIMVVTGTSLKEFTMDRSLEQAWDEMAAKFLRRSGIPFI